MTGIIGAVAQIDQGRDYGAKDGYRQVGNDIVAGVVASNPNQEMTAAEALLAVMLFKRR